MYQFLWESEERDVDFEGTLTLMNSRSSALKKSAVAAGILLISIIGSIAAYKKSEKVKKVVDEKIKKLKELMKKIAAPFASILKSVKGGLKAAMKFITTLYMKTLGKIFSRKNKTKDGENNQANTAKQNESILINSDLLIMTEASAKKTKEEAEELASFYDENKKEINKIVQKALDPDQIAKIKKDTRFITIMTWLLNPIAGAGLFITIIISEILRRKYYSESDLMEYYKIVLLTMIKTNIIIVLIILLIAAFFALMIAIGMQVATQ